MFIQPPVVMPVTRMEDTMIRILKHRKLLILLILVFLSTIRSLAQENIELVAGAVSYISGTNIYVKFASTDGIENGDTLFINSEGKHIPALLVQHHSSISCLCNAINGQVVHVDETILFKYKSKPAPVVIPEVQDTPDKDLNQQIIAAREQISKPKDLQDFSGRLSVSSYSNFSNQGTDSHRFRYTFSSLLSNIGNSKLSLETYLSFTHKLNEWDLIRQNLNNGLKVYDLSLKYELNEKSAVWLGRTINPNVANVGAVDGIQFEYGFGNMFAGLVAGSRPDYEDYGYNFDLFEYGVYFGHGQKIGNGFLKNSLAFFEQRNKGNIDRRFMYFQHTNSIVKNLTLFSSLELDLYKLENDQPVNTISLTGLYFSLNYRASQKLSLSGSYDNRKNVIYYETFRNYSDEVLQQASRQGIRLRVNYRPINYWLVGATGGTRFSENDPRPTKTANGFVTWSKVPGIDASLNISANLMQTAYLDGQIYGARLSRDFLKGKLYTMLNYRWVDFKYSNTITELRQNIGEIDFSYQFNKSFYLSVNYEATFQQKEWFNRLYLNLKYRF